MGVLKAKVDGEWLSLDRYTWGPNSANALGIVEVGQVTLPAGQSSPATDTEITTRLNYVLSSSRRYRLVLYIAAEQNGGYSMVLHSGGANTGRDAWITNPDYRWGSGTVEYLVTGNDISQAYSIKVGTIQGTPVIYHGASDLWYLEDLGPVSSSPPPLPAIPQAWTPVTFLSGWGNFGSGYAPGGYRKIGDTVYLRGLVSGGTVGAAVFVLPVGFRPAYNEIFAVDGYNHIHCTLDIHAPTGNVTFGSGSNTHISMSGVSFSVTA
jgi:hypothetical protein